MQSLISARRSDPKSLVARTPREPGVKNGRHQPARFKGASSNPAELRFQILLAQIDRPNSEPQQMNLASLDIVGKRTRWLPIMASMCLEGGWILRPQANKVSPSAAMTHTREL